MRRSHLLPLFLVVPTLAVAQDAAPTSDPGPSEVCQITLTQTITAPKKPDIFESVLDCGAKPTELQAYAAKLVNNAMNLASALEVMTDFGYTIEAGNTRDSYNGHQIISTFIVSAPNDSGTLPTAEPAAAPAELPEEGEATTEPTAPAASSEPFSLDDDSASTAIDDAAAPAPAAPSTEPSEALPAE